MGYKSYEELIATIDSPMELFNELNSFFGLREDGKEEAFLKWYNGD